MAAMMLAVCRLPSAVSPKPERIQVCIVQDET